MKNFRVSEKLCLPTSYFLWRILYLYIVTWNCKLWNHLFWLYLKISNIFVKKRKRKLQCNGKYLAVTGMEKMQQISLGFELYVSPVRCSTNWASWPLNIDFGWPLHDQNIYLHTLPQHFQTFWAILVLISWGQFPKRLSPNMFLFHSHCVSCILR
jgi:hypothetical protein